MKRLVEQLKSSLLKIQQNNWATNQRIREVLIKTKSYLIKLGVAQASDFLL
jgi:hypothetical protein